MSTLRSPFKFLDAFELKDRDVFFGRDREIEQLYNLVFKTPLLLIYGASGTGKTSLIQCGLASKFDGTDWLPLWIRRDIDINRSLQSAIKKVLPNPQSPITQSPNHSITDDILKLYQHYLRPVFLIFDQFEELFIFGTKEERHMFITEIKTILDKELPCNIIITIREEYLGQLYPFEKEIPELFDFRMRVEPMDSSHVKEVLDNSFHKFNITVEEPKDKRFEQIIENVSRSKSGIELPYLQVYLDKLYREDFERTYPNEKNTQNTEGVWRPLEFTEKEIRDFGTIDTVLDKFLEEQQTRIQAQVHQKDSTLKPDTVRLILDAFVSDEGTKRPIRYTPDKGLEANEQSYFPKISADNLQFCFTALESARLIRSDNQSIELAHDSLAALIDKRRTNEQRQRNDIKRQIRSTFQTFGTTHDYLSPKQIAAFEDILSELNLEEELFAFFKDSQKQRAKEALQALETEKARTKKFRMIAILAGLGFLIAFWVGIWAFQQKGIADSERNNAEKSLDIAQKAQQKAETELEAREIAEFNDVLRRTQSILSRATNCPDSEMIKAIDSMKIKYPKNTKLQNEIQSIDSQLARCR